MGCIEPTEKKGSDHHPAASDSWWLDKNSCDHNRVHQSQWLQPTLADMERKTKMILELVEDNGDTFAQRAEMYYKKRPELIKVVVELQRSYISLANKYDLLRSESLCNAGGLFSNSLRLQSVPSSAGLVHIQEEEEEEEEAQVQDKGINPKISEDEHQLLGPHVCTYNSSSGLPESWTLSNLVQSLMMSKDPRDEKLMRDKGDEEGCKVCNINGNTTDNEMNKLLVSAGGGFDDDSKKYNSSSNSIITRHSSERENTWNKMRLSVSELIEDNLSQQAELIKRNNEKRKCIKELGLYINQLQNENKRLKESLAKQQQQQQLNATGNKTINQHIKQNQSHLSKLKCLFFRKKL